MSHVEFGGPSVMRCDECGKITHIFWDFWLCTGRYCWRFPWTFWSKYQKAPTPPPDEIAIKDYVLKGGGWNDGTKSGRMLFSKNKGEWAEEIRVKTGDIISYRFEGRGD